MFGSCWCLVGSSRLFVFVCRLCTYIDVLGYFGCLLACWLALFWYYWLIDLLVAVVCLLLALFWDSFGFDWIGGYAVLLGGCVGCLFADCFCVLLFDLLFGVSCLLLN